PPLKGFVGTKMQIASAGSGMLQKTRGSFVYDGAATDKVRRLTSFRRVPDYPVIVLVSQGYDDALATYYERRAVVFGVSGAITALALLALAFLGRIQRQARLRSAEL